MTSATAPSRAPATPGPMIVARPQGRNAVVKLFVFVPLLALLAAVPAAWGWGLSWIDASLGVGFYFLTCAGATVGFHRYFTHARSRPSDRCGSRWPWWAAWPSRARSSPGSPTTAATTHSPTNRATRTHRGCSAPPPPPWRRGSGTPHFGWMLNNELTNPARFAPDLLADPDVARVNRRSRSGPR